MNQRTQLYEISIDGFSFWCRCRSHAMELKKRWKREPDGEPQKASVRRAENGNLLIRINGKRPLRQLERILRIHGPTETAEKEFVFQFLGAWNLMQEKPENVGALTSAPLVTDGVNVWGFMDYQIRSFLTELAEGKTVEWQKG